jgi:signal transduction histidine kinase
MANFQPLHFKVHAETKNIIGQDLINDDSIAIVELVKNGFDAGAVAVEVLFVGPVSQGASIDAAQIVIKDNGKGMSDADISDKWLNIGYSEKRVDKSTGRKLAGNKGVGRFACDRLGKVLNMYTRKSKSAPIQLVQVKWSNFENKATLESTIQSVPVDLGQISLSDYRKATGFSSFDHGTTIVISALRANWDREKLVTLRRSLERFVEPNAAFESNSFSIELQADEFEETESSEDPSDRINGKIENQIFQKLKYNTTYITASISEDAKSIKTELFHEGQRVYSVVEKNTDFPLLSNVKLVLHYLNSYKKAYFKRQTGLTNIDFGSVFLFLNGYRIPPYGDRENDWLRLSSRKSQGNMRYLGAREVVGRIEVIDNNGLFRVVSNREGVVRSDAFLQLVGAKLTAGWFYSSLKRLERFVVDGLGWDSIPEEEQRLLDMGKLPGKNQANMTEKYIESLDTKQRRVAFRLMSMIDAKPPNTIKLVVDPTLFDSLKRERNQDVQAIFERLAKFDGSIIDQKTKLAMSSLQNEFVRQASALEDTRKKVLDEKTKVASLSSRVTGLSEASKVLQKKVDTQAKELLFSRKMREKQKEELMLLHHHSGIYADTARNNLARLVEAIQSEDKKKSLSLVAKISQSVNRVFMVSEFATKMSFSGDVGADKLTNDVVLFIENYLTEVVSPIKKPGIRIEIVNNITQAFKIRFRPFDMAILIDNLVSNAERADAKKITFSFKPATDNEISLTVQDDGKGLSPDIYPPESAFNLGVTTTRGSGLGLFHVKQIVEDLKGVVSLASDVSQGFGLLIRLFK